MELKYPIIFSILIVSLIPSAISVFTIKGAEAVAKHGFQVFKAISSGKLKISKKKWEKHVTKTLDDILSHTHRLEALMKYESERIIDELSLKIEMQVVREFIEAVTYVNKRYEDRFVKYYFRELNETFHHNIFFNEMLREDSNFKRNLDKIGEFIVSNYYSNYFEGKKVFEILLHFHRIKAMHNEDCNDGSSYHQQLYSIYNLVIVTLIRGYSMIIHAHKLSGSKVRDIENTIVEFREVVSDIAEEVQIAMDSTLKTIYRCTPEIHVEGVTHIRLKRFLSLYLTSQASMGDTSWHHSCDYYDRFEVRNNHQLGCKGMAHDCWKTLVVQVCPMGENGRRYEALQEWYFFRHYVKGTWSNQCSKKKISTAYITRDPLANICACTCDDYRDRNSTRTFSLRRQYTNISEKRVVTGLKFSERNQVIYIDIQEGQWVNGTVDPDTIKWNYNASYPPLHGSETEILSYDRRSFNLDDITLPSGSVVTGIKFGIRNRRLTLIVAGVKVYDENGGNHEWSSMKWYIPVDKSSRSELKLERPDLPTFGNDDNVEISNAGKQYIKFQTTDWAKDASQTTVPYLDSQEILTYPPSAIGGVGIFFKNQPETGGFLALKLIAFNYSIQINKENIAGIFSYLPYDQTSNREKSRAKIIV